MFYAGPFFGLRRLDAAFFLFFHTKKRKKAASRRRNGLTSLSFLSFSKQIKESGVKPPQSKKWRCQVPLPFFVDCDYGPRREDGPMRNQLAKSNYLVFCVTSAIGPLLRSFGPLGVLLSLCLPGCLTTPPDTRVQRLNEDGVFLYQKGDYVRARESFEFALSLKPDDAGLLYNVGQCFERQGNVKKAEECYRLCLQKEESHIEGQQALTKLLLTQGRKTEAKDAVQTWLAAQPKVAEAYAQDGWRLHQEGDLLQAIARVQQALEMNPHNVTALTQMGQLYEAQERPDRALVLYEKALTQDPTREDLRDRINMLIAKGVRPPLPDN